jgi:uncharacterized protein YjbI with pentapeptide repeats
VSNAGTIRQAIAKARHLFDEAVARASELPRSTSALYHEGPRRRTHPRASVDETRFEEVQFTSCDLASADLRGAQFILCTMSSVVLRGIVLGNNHFYGTTLVEPIGLAQEARRAIERCGGVFADLTVPVSLLPPLTFCRH